MLRKILKFVVIILVIVGLYLLIVAFWVARRLLGSLVLGLLEAYCLPTNSIDFSHNEDSLQLEESILATGARPVEELSVHVSLAL